jgi:hypothetical protein
MAETIIRTEDVESSNTDDVALSDVSLAAGEATANAENAQETATTAEQTATNAQQLADAAAIAAAETVVSMDELRGMIATQAAENAALRAEMQAEISRLNDAMLLLADIKASEDDAEPQPPDPEPKMVHPLNRRLWKPLTQKG